MCTRLAYLLQFVITSFYFELKVLEIVGQVYNIYNPVLEWLILHTTIKNHVCYGTGFLSRMQENNLKKWGGNA